MRTWADTVDDSESNDESKISCQDEYCGTPATCLYQSSTCGSLGSTPSSGSRRDATSVNDASDDELETAAHRVDDAAKSDSCLHSQGSTVEEARDAAYCYGPVLMELLPDGSMVPPRNLITTFMMKNIRNKFTQEKVLSDLEANGFWGTFDFFYMPFDPDTKGNLGYAFINLSAGAVWAFEKFCKDWQIGKLGTGEHQRRKGIELVEASLQGFAANYGFYSSKRFKHEDPSAQPLFLREPLPEETFEIQEQAHRFARKRGSDGRRPRGSTRLRQCKYEHPEFCHQCGEQVACDRHKFCVQCGAKL